MSESEINNPLKTILKGTKIIAFGIIFSKIFGYIYRIIAARAGIYEYGLLSIGIAILGLLTSVSLIGLGDGLLRYVSFYKGKEDYARIKSMLGFSVKIVSIISIFLSIIVFIFSKWLAINLFHDQELNIIIKLFAVIIPFNSLREIFFKIVRALQKVEYEVYSKHIIENVTKVSLSFIFTFLGYRLFGLTVAYIISIFLSFIAAFYFLNSKVLKQKDEEIVSLSLNKELLVYSLPLLFSTLIFSVILWTDTLMLGYFTSPQETGLYNAALPTSGLMFMVPLIMLTLFIPVLTEIYSQSKNEVFKSIYIIITKWIFSINIILLSFFCLFSSQVLSILFGRAYVEASASLIILSLGYFVGYAMSSTQDILMIHKKTKTIFLNSMIMMIINLILNIYLIPIYGINGAALATATAFITRSILLMIEVKYYLGITPFNAKYIKVFSSIVIATVSVYYLRKYLLLLPNIIAAPFGFLALVTIYILLLIITKAFEREDIMVIKLIQEKSGINFTKMNRILKKL
ncbi:flippase [Candidatus Woesearchaeota archaeon]|nr:flippase [Candidatus Woesearchaeota archaeon]